MLAYRLGYSISQVEQMNITEFMEWIAFLEMHDQQNKLQINKQFRR